MSHPYYPDLLRPLRVRNYILKNRMGLSRSIPTNFIGYGSSPLESIARYLGMQAENGAAIVTAPSPHWEDPNSRGSFFGMGEMEPPKKTKRDPEMMMLGNPDAYDAMPISEMQGADITRANVRAVFSRAAAAVRAHDSLPAISMMEIEPNGWRIDDIPAEYLDQMCRNFAKAAQLYRDIGFSLGCFYMSYRNSLLAQSLSPELNHRTDRYAGPTALSRAVFGAVRSAVKDDFLIEIQVSGEELTPDGYKIGGLIEYVKGVEDLVDIVQLRSADAAVAHPLGLNSQRGVYDTMRFARAMKEAGVKAIIAPVGGYQDPEYNDMAIRNGWCDMIYMARAFICDSEYGKKVAEGRREDIIPCVRCNKCHHSPWTWGYGCTANPRLAVDWDDNITRSFPADPAPKKVAVIGGGPAGMWAALTAARRGHRVTLFERSGALGGQLIHADYADFKWPLRDYKNYLIAQLDKSPVEVRLNAAITPEEAKAEGFEAVLLALGSDAVYPNIPGRDKAHVHTPIAVFGEAEKTLGERVVVIGGSETGVETGLYLARAGHRVHLVTRADRLAKDAQPVHYIDVLTHMYNTEPNFEYTKFSATREITDTEVVIENDEGTFRLPCDDVVLCGGVRPRQEEALRWLEAFDAGAVRLVGDCQRPGDVRTGIRSAYIAAMML